MSLVKSVSVSGDDVFDEDADEISLQNKEWKHYMVKRVKDGYVEGIDAAKAAFLQVGFEVGYREGAGKTESLGRLKGIVSAIQCWCQQRPPPNNSCPVSVSGLLQRVVQHEDRLMKEMRYVLENPPASTGSDSLEVLGIHLEKEEASWGLGEKDKGSPNPPPGGGGEGGKCCGGGGCGREEGGEGGGCGQEGGGDGGGGGKCNKTGCCQKGGEEKMKQEPCSKASSSSISSLASSRSFDFGESLHELVRACEDLVEELGLPQELIEHLLPLRSTA